MPTRYESNRGWVDLQTDLLEALPCDAVVDLDFKEGTGHSAVVRKRPGDPDYAALYIYSGPRVGDDWDTLVLVDVQSTIGRYDDAAVAVGVASKWARGKLRRPKR